jgi:hypothetical protein
MAEQSETKDSAVSKPTNTQAETAQAIATLLDNKETARNDEPKTSKLEDKNSDLEKDTNDPILEDLDVDNIVDNDEAKLESQEELYDITVNGNKIKVTLDELLKGYSRESDYTQKTQDLGNQRRDVESMRENLKKELDAVKNSRTQYAQQLDTLSKQLSQEDNIDWDTLYREDPAEYVKRKADADKRKEAIQLAQQERHRIQEEERREQEKVYQDYLEKERRILAEKLPVYSDPNKREEFTRRLTNFAKEQVDHRAVLTLADAYRYNQLKKTKLASKKVNKAPKTLTSNASNVRDESETKQRIDAKKSQLRKSGKMQDAVTILEEMYS